MSVIDQTATATTATTNTGTSYEDQITDLFTRSTTQFRDILSEISEWQARTAETLKYIDEFTEKRSADNLLASIGDRLSNFFAPEMDVSGNLRDLMQWFTSSGGSRRNFMTLLDYLSTDKPASAAGLLNDLFSLQASFARAAAVTGGEGIFSTIASFGFNFQDLSGISLPGMDGGLSFSSPGGGFRLGALSMEVKMQQVMRYSVEESEVEDWQKAENGGYMIKVQGKYVNMAVYLKVMDPLVLDLEGDGIELRGVEEGVVFDLKGDGTQVRTGFVRGDDALLFLDDNGNGICDNGNELFGDQQGHAHGFAKLSTHDLNSDGIIDDKDGVYDKLRVWNDFNGDGICQEDEVRSLRDAGVAAIGLGYRDTHEVNNGNIISQKGFFRRFDGALRAIVDANFRYHEL